MDEKGGMKMVDGREGRKKKGNEGGMDQNRGREKKKEQYRETRRGIMDRAELRGERMGRASQEERREGDGGEA